jgi:hypothetical protein
MLISDEIINNEKINKIFMAYNLSKKKQHIKKYNLAFQFFFFFFFFSFGALKTFAVIGPNKLSK